MFWSISPRAHTPRLESDRLILRAPGRADYRAWADLRYRSREFLRPYEPRWTDADLGRRLYMGRLRRMAREAAEGTDLTYFIFRRRAGRGAELAGGLTLSNIRRRAAQHATLGYWMGQDHAGQGIMTEAVGMICDLVFERMELHRLHAAFVPGNEASRRVLEKNGFIEEGFAVSYLQINGKWADHVLCGLTEERFFSLRRPGRLA